MSQADFFSRMPFERIWLIPSWLPDPISRSSMRVATRRVDALIGRRNYGWYCGSKTGLLFSAVSIDLSSEFDRPEKSIRCAWANAPNGMAAASRRTAWNVRTHFWRLRPTHGERSLNPVTLQFIEDAVVAGILH